MLKYTDLEKIHATSSDFDRLHLTAQDHKTFDIIEIKNDLIEKFHSAPFKAINLPKKIRLISNILTMQKIEDLLFLHSLIDVVDIHLIEKFFEGAYFKLLDDQLYHQALGHSSIKTRISSHKNFSGLKQLSLRIPGIIEELLIGVCEDRAYGCIWFQSEAHSTRGSFGKILHFIDYVQYVLSGRAYNVGPFGFSPHTEQNPIVIDPYSSESLWNKINQS